MRVFVLAVSVIWIFSTLTRLMAAEGNLDSKRPLIASRYWSQIESGLGSMNLSGTLRLTYELDQSQPLKMLGLRLTLEHVVEAGPNGQACSIWRVTGLRSFLVPADRGHLRWQPLAGPSVWFEKAKISRALNEAGSSRWLIREAVDNEFEIRSLDGRSWKYNRGILTKAQHPALGELYFITQGGLLHDMHAVDALSGAASLLTVKYDDSARPVSLILGGKELHRFEWNAAGQLTAWRQIGKSPTLFRYFEGLLTEVEESGRVLQHYSWTVNPGYRRGDSRWPAPVHLASDRTSDYSYKQSSKGFILSRRDRSAVETTTTIFNPRRRQLKQSAGDSSIIATFRRGTKLDRMGLERIASGDGDILEEYRYDEKGQLVGLKRRGEPERQLSYDDLGRLMALDESATP